MFGLPMGAVIESWPVSSTSNTNYRPSFNTFVLNVNSEDGVIAERVYGASLIFYEDFDDTKLTGAQFLSLKYAKTADEKNAKTLHANKCLLLLSRHPFFDTFREFLYFLFNNYTKSSTSKNIIPIERYTTKQKS